MDPLVLYIIALLLLVYRVMCAKKKEIAFLAVALAAGAALAVYVGTDVLIMLLGILVFNGLASTYHSKENYAFFLLALFFFSITYTAPQLLAQTMLFGFLSAAYFFTKHSARVNLIVERKRDIAQVILGFGFIVSFVFVPSAYVRLTLMLAILAFSLFGNYSASNKKSPLSKMLYSFERRDAILGQGAMWLAAGALVALAFLNNRGLAAVLTAIFLGDAVATLVGTTVQKPRLPYNKAKSLSGTLAYFIVTAVISFPIIGYPALLTAFVAAIVESVPRHIDDNLDTAIVLTGLLALLGYASIAL
ncbi:MAG: hypothetical protein KGH57_02560 [Candidatus Micrarchaeota archaeon]|nr:hypothetical protein [Candidatus Micrarchaeota archaeon]